MSSEKCQLADIAIIQGGYAFKSADFGDEGVAVVKIANIKPPVVSLDDVDRVTPDKVIGLDRFRLNDGDVLMAMTGATVGKVGRFQESELAYLNQRVARISARHSKEYLDYIYAVVSQPGFDSLIEGASAGSAQANISAAGIGAVQIPLLDGKEQLAIGRIARSLDDRITLLRETNATLEAIAQALFKSWFVDFGPVRAKMEGRAPEGMDEATAALFPDALEESDLGWIPSGWRVGPLGEVAVLKGGKQLEKVAFEDDGANPVFGGAGEMGRSNLSNASGFVITVGRVGAYCGQFFWHLGDAWVNNNASQIKPRDEAQSIWMYQWLKSVNMDLIKKGAAQPFVSNGDIALLKMAIPLEPVISRFVEICEPIFRNRHLLHEQTQTLATLRDTLLPRLISGQLRLPEMADPVSI